MSPPYRLRILPRSPWRTPWQADTLAGALLATCARTHGPGVLRDKLIDPMLAGAPPFVLSDALPGELLPLPIHLRLHRYPDGANLKAIKRGRWLAPEHFDLARAGTAPSPENLIPDSAVFCDSTRHHNTLSRLTDTSSREDDQTESAIGLYQKSDTLLRVPADGAGRLATLTVYFRFADNPGGDLLLDLLHELSLTGFGADISTGRGQFDLPEDPQPAPHLDQPPPNANGVISLSTFQPGPADPTDGYWEAFPKFGKLGPDFGLADVRKNTLILFRPGACFRSEPSRQFLGRAVPMHELLPPNSVEELKRRSFNIIHPAFGLVLPAMIPGD